MKEVMLIAAALAFVAFGFFVMRRLDAFLFRNHIAIEQPPRRQESTLRIAFSNPLVAGAVAASLARLCTLHNELEVSLYAGDAETIRTQLAAQEIDMAFLPDPAAEDGAESWGQVCVSLPQRTIREGAGNLSVRPLGDDRIVQWITWRKTACTGRAGACIAMLAKDLCPIGGSVGGKML